MKKKLLLVTVMVALLLCALAVSVSAVTGSATNEYGTVTSVDGASAKDKLDTTSRVVLKNADGTYTTYPAYYVLKNNTSASFDFAELNELTKESYSKTSVARIELPNAITVINNGMFKSDTELIEIDLPSALQQVNHEAFYGCTNLQYIDGNDGLLIFPEGFTTIKDNNAFYNCDKIKYIEFPSTFTFLGQAAFNDCSSLLLVSFDKINEAIENGTRTARVNFNNCGTFKNCTNLVALSLPELTTVVINRLASNCPNLTAVYMPNSVKQIGTNGADNNKYGNGLGAFDYDVSMYFVQESFTVSQCIVNGAVDLTKLSLPEKPSVYYMPTSFVEFIGHVESNQWSKNGTVFRGCTALNETIVFHEGFTYFNANNVFNGIGTEASPKNIVFLGDMAQCITMQNSSYISFYFANSADKAPSDIGISRYVEKNNTTESYWYFCHGGARYDYAIAKSSMNSDIAVNLETILATKDTVNFVHIAERQGAIDATCTLPAGIATFCFCGGVASVNAADGSSPLGHELSVENGAIDLGIAYIDFFAKGEHSYACARCKEVCTEETEATFEWKGYSVSTFGDTFSMTQGFLVNRDALKEYKKYAPDFEFGLIIAGNKSEDGAAFAPELSGDLCVPQSHIAHNYFDIKITGITSDFTDKLVVFCAFVKNGEKVYYLDNHTTSETVTGISYNAILALLG